MKFIITKKIIECEVELTLSHSEIKMLLNAVDHLEVYQRGLHPSLRTLQSHLSSVMEEIKAAPQTP